MYKNIYIYIYIFIYLFITMYAPPPLCRLLHMVVAINRGILIQTPKMFSFFLSGPPLKEYPSFWDAKP